MKPCLFSVSYAGYWGQDALSTNRFVEHAAELGYASVMIAGKRPHASPLDMNEETIAALRATLDRTGVECSIMAAYTDFGGTVAAEVPYLEMQISYIESLCRIGQQLGASVCRLFTSYEVDGVSPHATWKQTVGCLQEICDRAADFGITIAVQNHHDIAVQSEALVELLFDVDRKNCGLGFDAWSLALRGEELHQAARKMAPHTVITTNADYLRFPRFRYRPELISYESAGPDLVRAVPFGEGFIDYEAFFSGLKEGGFDGLATYEMCSPVRGGGSMDNLDRYAKAYLDWMSGHGFV
jgi:sugar phosphate isomerase/epimerase